MTQIQIRVFQRMVLLQKTKYSFKIIFVIKHFLVPLVGCIKISKSQKTKDFIKDKYIIIHLIQRKSKIFEDIRILLPTRRMFYSEPS